MSWNPPKWWLTWVAVLAAFVHLACASFGVAEFISTLEPGLYFYGALSGFGTAGAVTLHATGRKWHTRAPDAGEEGALG